MANEWEGIPLGDLITLQRGFDLPSQDRKPGKVPIVSSSGISDYHSEVGVKGPGVGDRPIRNHRASVPQSRKTTGRLTPLFG